MISMAVKALMWSCGQAVRMPRKHVEVIVELQPGVQAADDVDLGGAGVGGSAGGGDHLLDGHFIGAVFAALAVEGAELAGEGADVGVIDVAVAVVIGAVAVEFFADEICEPADAVDVAAVVEGEAVLGGETLAGGDFFGDGKEGGVGGL